MPQRLRTQARTLALQALCQYDALGDKFEAELDVFLTDVSLRADLDMATSLPGHVISFARKLAHDAWLSRAELDATLARNVTGWSIGRMPPVDRNVLRIGLYELLHEPDTPPQVVINEAIDLARRFGDKDSAGFVNGVLDGVRRELGIEVQLYKKPHEG
jgi:N utilization substance protein B